MGYIITSVLQKDFETHLFLEEKSNATIEKYTRDVRAFQSYARDCCIDKTVVLEYKRYLSEHYAIASANSMIASVNSFFRFCGWHELIIKPFRVQRQMFCAEEKELSKREYMRLISTAERLGDKRISLIIQTICGTGIRVSELQYITVEAVRQGEARVNCKGKTRRIFLVPELRKKLLAYIMEEGLMRGSVFITRNRTPLSRIQIWRKMKLLCRAANVSETKVFPHNLRHLFARVFYSNEKDIVMLADLLGHSSINTTRIYTITTGDRHKYKMNMMGLVISNKKAEISPGCVNPT